MVIVKSCDRIWDSCVCFMLIAAMRSVGAISVDFATRADEVCVVVVEDTAGGVFTAVIGSAKCIVIVAGPF